MENIVLTIREYHDKPIMTRLYQWQRNASITDILLLQDGELRIDFEEGKAKELYEVLKEYFE